MAGSDIRTGPLRGIRILELAGLGPAPFCGMLLADHGAEVIRVARPQAAPGNAHIEATSILNRSRREIVVDLKRPEGTRVLCDLACKVDGLIEGFRPGVMEGLGLGPDALFELNPHLVYGRMTGWGQTGSCAAQAGHDINYLALSGVLSLLGRPGQKPTPPINLLADFGGGGMLLAFAMVTGILCARRTGAGQVVDCSMLEGAALLSSMIWGFRAQGRWDGSPGTNFLDTGAPFYEVYECADGRHICVGALEPEFYARLRAVLGLSADPLFDEQHDRTRWPLLKQRLEAIFRSRTREQWCALFDGADACFAPVLSLEEAAVHPHNAARGSFITTGGVTQPAPAPRWSCTPNQLPSTPERAGRDGVDVLREIGYRPERIHELQAAGIVG